MVLSASLLVYLRHFIVATAGDITAGLMEGCSPDPAECRSFGDAAVDVPTPPSPGSESRDRCQQMPRHARMQSDSPSPADSVKWIARCRRVSGSAADKVVLPEMWLLNQDGNLCELGDPDDVSRRSRMNPRTGFAAWEVESSSSDGACSSPEPGLFRAPVVLGPRRKASRGQVCDGSEAVSRTKGSRFCRTRTT